MANETTLRRTVGQALAHYLAVQYSEFEGERRRLIPGVWGIFGHGNVAGFGQALQEYGDRLDLPLYRPQNEQGQVHAAAAFARHADRLATFACTASVGPGSTNMITGAALATINRLPVLLLPSDIFANRIPDPVLQQLEHPSEHDVSVNDAFRPVSRFYTRISRPEQLLHALPEAMRVLTDPAETGAVTISLPEDVQAEAYDWPRAFFEPRTWRIRRPVPEPDAITEAVQHLRSARNPIIIAGGGVKYAHASDALARLAERHAIPIVETQAGKGAVPWDHPTNLGSVGTLGTIPGNTFAESADVVLAIGTRLSDFTTASRSILPAGATLLHVNVSAMDAFKMQGVPIVADAKHALTTLDAALGVAPLQGAASRRAALDEARATWHALVDDITAPRGGEGVTQPEVLGITQEVFGGDAVVINAAGSMPGDLVRLWRPTDPRAYHVEYGFSCMGYEIPAGIGVRMAEPDPQRPVVTLIGDGSYLMMNSELVTAVAEGLDLTLIVVDNHGFQSIHGLQRSCGTPTFGVELRHRDASSGHLDGNPVAIDFTAHATAMGANAVFTRDADAFRSALTSARGARGVQVIVVETQPDARAGSYGIGAWWDVPIAETSDQASVQEARAKYVEALEGQVRYR